MQNKQSLLLRNQIPKNWQKVKFEDLFLEPVRNGVYKKKEFHGRGQKVVNMGELFAFNFISNQDMKRVALNSSELEKNLLWDGDLLFARRSLVLEGSGKCSIVRKPNEETTFESSIIRTRLDKKIAEPLFYYYYFKSPQGRGVMASIASQTAVSGITGNNLSQLNVPVPPKSVQLQIASILSAFDDLIENNNKQTKILEEMAQAIYKEWFVKFRFPGHEKVKMIESGTEYGMIPEEWEVRKLGDKLNILKGKNITKNTIIHGKVPVVAGGLNPAYYHNKANAQSPVITISASGANSGFVNLYQEDVWVSDCSYIDRKTTSFVYFYYLFLKNKQIEITGLQRGSAQPHVYPKDLMQLTIIDIPEVLTKAFEQKVELMFGALKNLKNQNQCLRQSRDLLLPKLMRGEIRI